MSGPVLRDGRNLHRKGHQKVNANPTVPDYLVRMLSWIAPMPISPTEDPDPEAWRAYLTRIAQSIWMDGWQEGYGFRASIEPIRMTVTAEELEQIKEKFKKP